MEKLSLTESRLPDEAVEDIQKMTKILSGYGANRVILYGSFARGDFRTDSDLDLCVEGMPAEHYFRALAECLMQAERPVSVVDFEDIYGYLRQRVIKEGKILYEQE